MNRALGYTPVLEDGSLSNFVSVSISSPSLNGPSSSFALVRLPGADYAVFECYLLLRAARASLKCLYNVLASHNSSRYERNYCAILRVLLDP